MRPDVLKCLVLFLSLCVCPPGLDLFEGDIMEVSNVNYVFLPFFSSCKIVEFVFIHFTPLLQPRPSRQKQELPGMPSWQAKKSCGTSLFLMY